MVKNENRNLANVYCRAHCRKTRISRWARSSGDLSGRDETAKKTRKRKMVEEPKTNAESRMLFTRISDGE